MGKCPEILDTVSVEVQLEDLPTNPIGVVSAPVSRGDLIPVG